MKIKPLLILALSISFGVHGQKTSISGKVRDHETKEALPFVNISVENTREGTASGIDGRFRITAEKSSKLIFSYVGYAPRKLNLTSYSDTTSFLTVDLTRISHELQTVEVTAGENPAFEIIRRVIRNRDKNNPENLRSFSYKAYHKFYATAESETELPSDTTKFASFIRNNHLFLNETFSERKYIRPDLDKETVLGNRMSGVKDPFFAILATNFQPFSFYKEHITLLEKNYLNPISPGSTTRYDFEISDTVYRASDTTFLISFRPLAGKTFEGLEGVLYINTKGYAIEHVLATTYDERALMTIKIQQKYHLIDDHWFPGQLNTEFILNENKVASRTIKYVHRSYLTDITINSDISKKTFGLVNVEFDPLANRKNEEFWKTVRLDSLARKERNTYKLYDSLGRSNKLATLNAIIKTGEAFAIGKFKAGAFYIPIESILKINRYEDVRFGFGLQSGENISRIISMEGYTGYGVRDKALKYGGGLQLNLDKQNELYLKFNYRTDIDEPGNADFIKGAPLASGGQHFRKWLAFRMDSLQQYKAMLHARPFRFVQAVLFFQQMNIKPTYGYAYTEDDVTLLHSYTSTEAGLQFRFAFKENHAQLGPHVIVTNYAVPQINLVISKSLPDVWSGQFSFTKAEIRLDHHFVTRGLGKTSLQFNGGVLNGNAPYTFLFNGRAAWSGESFVNGFVIPGYFQTMRLYEFFSDRYASFFITHNFGRLTSTRPKYFRPELALTHGTGFGTLRRTDVHKGIVFNTMEKGYHESGLILTNIFRFKYLNVLYFGLGAGAFCRYGNYRFETIEGNLSVKAMVTASF